MATSVVQFRIDDDLKMEATAICDKLGIDLSTAMRMFLKRTVMENGIPFPMTLDNTYNSSYALQAVREMNSQAKQSGNENMTLEEINAEISAYRKERKSE